jgi:hypothetical protein
MRTATRRAPGLAGFAKTRAEHQLVEALERQVDEQGYPRLEITMRQKGRVFDAPLR